MNTQKFFRLLVFVSICCQFAQSAAFGDELLAASQAKKHGARETVFDKPSKKNVPGTAMTVDAWNVAKLLNIDGTLDELKAAVRLAGGSPSQDDLVKIMFLRQTIARKMQYAGLELEEALANIAGDLSLTNLQLSIFTAKHERSVMLNNVAAFMTSGSLGVLDSAISITQPPPFANILGITGNASAIAIPLWGLRPRKYKPLRTEAGGNMLAPLFDFPYDGEGYDPIIWKYLESVPADSKDNLTRRQLLIQTWKKFRSFDAKSEKGKEELKQLAEVSRSKTVTLELLKSRSELLVDLQSTLHQMYRDLSDLNTEVMNY